MLTLVVVIFGVVIIIIIIILAVDALLYGISDADVWLGIDVVYAVGVFAISLVEMMVVSNMYVAPVMSVVILGAFAGARLLYKQHHMRSRFEMRLINQPS